MAELPFAFSPSTPPAAAPPPPAAPAPPATPARVNPEPPGTPAEPPANLEAIVQIAFNNN